MKNRGHFTADASTNSVLSERRFDAWLEELDQYLMGEGSLMETPMPDGRRLRGYTKRELKALGHRLLKHAEAKRAEGLWLQAIAPMLPD